MNADVGLTLASREDQSGRDLAVVAASHDVLAAHARSFSWAASFLPSDRRHDAAVLYAFCRGVDDAADEAPDRETATVELDAYERGLHGTSSTGAPEVCAELRRIAQRRSMPLVAAQQLITGIRSDLDPVRIEDDRELIRYCYYAAGTVGWMMCGVLGVDHPEAIAHAVDLGIAMQLTNICRDVLEDANRGRVYLPRSRLLAAGTSTEAVLAGTADRDALRRVVLDLLDLADTYYASADAGMRYIPARPRLAILVAARVYRAIGVKLRRRYRGDALHGRTFVSSPMKALWTLNAIGAWFNASTGRAPYRQPHRPSLHDPLLDLLAASR
ncbi:MAG: phytoene/squalene synthase family protein [Myxococcota bacterium]